MLCGALKAKETQKRGEVCVPRADSLCCIAEMNTPLLEQLYSNLKKKFQKSKVAKCHEIV